MFDIIGKSKYSYVLSGLLIFLSIISLIVWGLRYGIDFTGGTLMEIKFSEAPSNQEVRVALEELNIKDVIIQPTRDNAILLRYAGSSDEENSAVLEKLKERFGEVTQARLDYVSPTISGELKRKSLMAIAVALVGIALYIAYAFRKVSRPVESWKYGVGAIVALTHDVLITVGIFSVLGKFAGIEIGTPFIAALLTILGFSVHDTIVVYDRTRENLLRAGSREDFTEVVNRSLNETLTRSINTSLTVIVTLLAIFILGGESIRSFTLALLIGVAFGTYSSIFIASALLVSWWKWEKRKI